MSTTLTFLLSVTTAFAAVSRVDVDTRYFITQFNAGEFPMSIGTCNPFSVLGDGVFQKAVCDSETQLSWMQYTNPECSGFPLQTIVTNSSSTQSNMGTYLDFNCNPMFDDASTAVEFSTGTCDTNTKVTMNAALESCAINTLLGDEEPEDITSLRVYCDSTIAELQYFATPNEMFARCNDTDNFYQVRNATTTCGFMLTATAPDGSDVDVFGKLIQCSVDPVPTSEPDSGSKLSIIIGIITVAIFSLLSM